MHTSFGGRYDPQENIGHGGMSDVYSATDTLLGRQVALKVLRMELARDENFRERFRREAQNSSRLNHPNIVAVYDTGEQLIDGVSVPYIVMELVHGTTLRGIVHDRGPYSPSEAAQVMIPVCSALQASHDAGIIHRDIKPANIMVTNTGQVKVMDFGIARALDDATSAMTQTSAVIGTAQYLSPEQARGRNADARSDVYALGCVLYEAITGRPPFEGESPFDVAYQHVHETPTSPSEYASDLTPTMATNIDAVILTAMAKHPGDRYQSAAEFSSDLELVMRNAVTHAAKMHLSGPVGAKLENTHRQGEGPAHTAIIGDSGEISAAAASAAGAAGAAGAASAGAQHYGSQNEYSAPTQYAAAQQAPAQQSPQGGHRKQKSSRWGVWLTSILAVVVVGIGAAFAVDYFGNREERVAESSISVPTIAGLEEQVATQRLRSAGFEVIRSEEPSPDVARGLALGTNPSADSTLPKGSTVTLIVSSGKEIVEVPQITGRTTEAANRELERVGLKLNSTPREQPSDTAPAGEIIEQSPPAGTAVSKGSEVSITISTGVENVRIPSLTGMKYEQAVGNLESAGFIPQPEYVESDKPEGTVLGVNGEGTKVPKGSTVIVRVSNGKKQITVPDLRGKNVNQAVAALRAAGWKGTQAQVRQEEEPTDDLTKQNTVASQVPAAGESIGDEDDVVLRIYRFSLLELAP
ncbi:Stk1 family PASTA domain-containing Ser/Thr kinase [Corynebacterium sp. TAE3-ERU2]|uniref:Stk1 family PASTA domain-containing Ser/Thr kinase n=1 Tax=Corynebacterium sp. TAE3-ERU2 TaxID=2849497 RepID=UPI001C44FF69|nr:Stk1 family PASTA domain-containing Ser/Thr kinase [Corynebacterium sp. TAE3-ERU2]MBV7302342.1 Stk1 family PASTA domain-containing Ser/Thr kinase [Corynebacterium sp. TAE3-ERU2]